MHIWRHFKTITSHKLLVMRYCFRIGLYRQGLAHDLSKYSWTEFSKGCRYWQGNRSPNNAEREDTGVSLAWLHHKGEINTILSTGLITALAATRLSRECRCQENMWRR